MYSSIRVSGKNIIIYFSSCIIFDPIDRYHHWCSRFMVIEDVEDYDKNVPISRGGIFYL